MDKIVEQIANGHITLDSKSAEYIARLWFINELVVGAWVIAVTILVVWGVRAVWKHEK